MEYTFLKIKVTYLKVKEPVGQRPIKEQKSKWFWKMFLLIMILKIFKIIIEYFCAFFYFLRDKNGNNFILTYIVKNVVFDAAKYGWLYLNILRVYVRFLMTLLSSFLGLFCVCPYIISSIWNCAFWKL